MSIEFIFEVRRFYGFLVIAAASERGRWIHGSPNFNSNCQNFSGTYVNIYILYVHIYIFFIYNMSFIKNNSDYPCKTFVSPFLDSETWGLSDFVGDPYVDERRGSQRAHREAARSEINLPFGLVLWNWLDRNPDNHLVGSGRYR